MRFLRVCIPNSSNNANGFNYNDGVDWIVINADQITSIKNYPEGDENRPMSMIRLSCGSTYYVYHDMNTIVRFAYKHQSSSDIETVTLSEIYK